MKKVKASDRRIPIGFTMKTSVLDQMDNYLSEKHKGQLSRVAYIEELVKTDLEKNDKISK